MGDASHGLSYVTGKSVRKVTGKSVHESENVERFAMLVESVLYDKNLSANAKCVFSVLTRHIFSGTVAKIGQRRIGKLLVIHQQTVGLALKELEERGHVVIIGSGKQRRMYHLTSKRFGMKQRALDAGESMIEDLIINGPRRRLATVRPA